MFEMDRDTSDNELIYRVEALPLDHLLVNSYPVDAKPCQAENSDLNCLEFNLLSAINLEKCTDNVKIYLSYSFNNSEWYSQQIKPMTFIASIDLRCKYLFILFDYIRLGNLSGIFLIFFFNFQISSGQSFK